MTNYDDLSANEARLAVEMAGDAELDELVPQPAPEDAQIIDALDAERLASWNLKRAREALGVSQQQIADRLVQGKSLVRLSQSQIAKIERGERPWRLNEVFAIAEALGIDFYDFFRGQHVSDDPAMELYAARLRVERAGIVEDDVRASWREAARAKREAERIYLVLAARRGGRDEYALEILQHRLAHRDYVRKSLEDSERLGFDAEGAEGRWSRLGESAEREWVRLVEDHADGGAPGAMHDSSSGDPGEGEVGLERGAPPRV
ncbi:helix-turn-helix domain-containing protein [Kitasatospora sp. NPDC001574]